MFWIAKAIWGRLPCGTRREGVLWWIDIYKPTLNRFDPKSGRNHEIALDQNIHAIAMRRTGGIVGSFQHGIGFVDPANGTVATLVDPIGTVQAKFNDGKCDRSGRFWTGSMSNDWVTPIGASFASMQIAPCGPWIPDLSFRTAWAGALMTAPCISPTLAIDHFCVRL